LVLDDIGYVQHDRDELEVLFTLLAERYERRSVAITTNLLFSEWDRIFKDPMTTMAAIDRVVHHSVILDLMGGMESYRAREAIEQQQTTPTLTDPRIPGDPPERRAGPRPAILIDVHQSARAITRRRLVLMLQGPWLGFGWDARASFATLGFLVVAAALALRFFRWE
jgi:IstB-like ATP binding protein